MPAMQASTIKREGSAYEWTTVAWVITYFQVNGSAPTYPNTRTTSVTYLITPKAGFLHFIHCASLRTAWRFRWLELLIPPGDRKSRLNLILDFPSSWQPSSDHGSQQPVAASLSDNVFRRSCR